MRLVAKGLGADALRNRIQVRHSRARVKLSHQCQQRREQPQQITTAAQHGELSYRRLRPDGPAIWLNMISATGRGGRPRRVSFASVCSVTSLANTSGSATPTGATREISAVNQPISRDAFSLEEAKCFGGIETTLP